MLSLAERLRATIDRRSKDDQPIFGIWSSSTDIEELLADGELLPTMDPEVFQFGDHIVGLYLKPGTWVSTVAEHGGMTLEEV